MIPIVCVIGVGRLGKSVARELLSLLPAGSKLVLCEPFEPNQERAAHYYWDMVGKAAARKIVLELASEFPVASAYIVTAGLPRESTMMSKLELLGENWEIVERLGDALPAGHPIYVATNPSRELAERLKREGLDARECRSCVDSLRGAVGDPDGINQCAFVPGEGTDVDPGFAIALQVMTGLIMRSEM